VKLSVELERRIGGSMSIRVDWTNYDPWKKMWDEWIRAYGENKIIMQQIQFLDLYNHFVRRVKEVREARPGFDVYTIDVEAFIDPKLTYEENRLILDKMLASPPTEKDYENMSEEYIDEAVKDVEAHYPEVVKNFRERIAELERETAREPEKDRERIKFKRLSKDLAEELEETKRMLEEAKKKPAEFKPFKIRILQPFSEGIMKYIVGDVVETRNVDWALEKIEKGLAERVGEKLPEVALKPKAEIYPAIIVEPSHSYKALFQKLYSEKWGVNDAEYMRADTLEEAVALQARTFPALEYQPVKLPPYMGGKWVAFHRKRLEYRPTEEKAAPIPSPSPKEAAVVPKPTPIEKPAIKPLAAIPELCPIDQTPLEEVTKIPLILRKKPELTQQEEWMRSTMGMPIPSFETKWLDVPPTMKVWMCKGNSKGLETHYFERDAITGKLIQRTPEYIYKKLIRETAAIQRLAAPATPMPPEMRPIYRRGYEWIPPKPTAELKPPALSFWDWIQQAPRNLTKLQFLKLEDVERKFLLDEYTRLCREAARK
jgi:hypothetical protein